MSKGKADFSSAFFYIVFCIQYILRNKASFSTIQKVRYIDNLEYTYMYSASIQ